MAENQKKDSSVLTKGLAASYNGIKWGVATILEILQVTLLWSQRNRKKNFLRYSSIAEVAALKRVNKEYQNYIYNLYQRIAGFLESHGKLVGALILLLIAILYIPIDVLVLNDSIISYEEQSKKQDRLLEFIQFSATIQVTLFAVVVPFSTAILQFVFKDYKSRINLIRIVYKETMVRFLTISSVMLTIALFLVDYIWVAWGVGISHWVVSIFAAWLLVNVIGIGYFIIIGLKFLTPYYRYHSLSKFSANEAYPNQLIAFVMRNMYSNLGSSSGGDDD